jgi:hypothetical protein
VSNEQLEVSVSNLILGAMRIAEAKNPKFPDYTIAQELQDEWIKMKKELRIA